MPIVYFLFFLLETTHPIRKTRKKEEMTKQQTNKTLTEWGCKCNAAVVMGCCRLRRPMVSASAPTSRIRKSGEEEKWDIRHRLQRDLVADNEGFC